MLFRSTFNYEFKNCLIKAGTDINTNTSNWINIFKNEQPKLKDPGNEKFELDTLSFCINKGDLNIGALFPWDMNGNSRISDNMPDLRAFEHP